MFDAVDVLLDVLVLDVADELFDVLLNVLDAMDVLLNVLDAADELLDVLGAADVLLDTDDPTVED